jgi:hypothetical protein
MSDPAYTGKEADMNIPEYVTVTIEMDHAAVLGDFRIPTGMSIARLTELLQQECDIDLCEPALCVNGYAISPSCTLGQAGIWDGSIITVRERTV